MSEIAIELKNVRKRFLNSEHDAVSDTSFKVKKGEIIVILGSSGSGKTTLLKMINRLHETTEGDIFFLGESIKSLSVNEYRRKIGYVIQQSGLFPHMRVEENIAVVPKVLNWNEEKISKRIDELMNLVKLPPKLYRRRYPRQLSGGEQQRVGLARAMAADPEVMLMDEPFGAVDPIVRKNLQDELIKIQNKLKKTILFVTHDIQEAFKLGDKVIIMDRGKIQQYDTPYNILFNPSNDFVKQFVSTENFMDNLKSILAVDALKPIDTKDNESKNIVESDTDLGTIFTMFIQKDIDYVLVKDSNDDILGKVTYNQLKEIIKLMTA